MTCRHIDRQLTNRLRLTGIYVCFGLYMLLCHLPLPYYGDDLQLLTFVEPQGFAERFWALYTKNGKIFTDLLAFAFCHVPLRVWKIFNTAVYVLVAILLERLFTKGRPLDALLSCALTAIFPLAYLELPATLQPAPITCIPWWDAFCLPAISEISGMGKRWAYGAICSFCRS